jgi:membrane associated rhomboid family serine protease
MSDNPFLQLYTNLPPGLQVVSGVYGFMLLLRLIDWIIFRDSMISRFGLWGLRARRPNRILAWFLNPFIHANWRHLWANSLPWLLMASLIALPLPLAFVVATAVIMAVSDLGIWLFEARNGATAGASGLVMGYFGFILLNGFFTKNSAAVIIGLVVLAFYYGLLRVIFIPQRGPISNVGHFFGFVGGVTAAWVWSVILERSA